MKSTFQDKLHIAYTPTGNTGWIDNLRHTFEDAKLHGLALAGSVAASVAYGTATKPPKDVDFVTDSLHAALAFLHTLQVRLASHSIHWKIGVNSHNDHTPPGCITHFRFWCPFWLPICVMVIPAEDFKCWYSVGGQPIQIFGKVKAAGDACGEKDGKVRIWNCLTDAVPLKESETPSVIGAQVPPALPGEGEDGEPRGIGWRIVGETPDILHEDGSGPPTPY